MNNKKRSRAAQFPFPVLAALVYLSLGFIWDLWHPGWLIFLTIPIYYYTVSLIESINNDEGKSLWKLLPYPIFCVIIYFILGYLGWWHPGWLIFLTIPLWSFFVNNDKDDSDTEVNLDGLDD